MEKQKSLVFLAQEVMVEESDRLDPVFLHVHFKLADNAGNQNHEGITEAFIKDLIANQDQYDCLPMYVDMERLLAGDFDNLTHLYSRVTKKFKTQQFGSFTNFYSETDANGVTSLYAEARFPKRELEACYKQVELFESGRLCLSIELRYNPEHTIRKDGVLFVDAYEDNSITGAAIVSTPAYEDAVALDMVAEAANDSEIVAECGEQTSDRGETDLKDKEEMTAEVTEVTQDAQDIVVAETEQIETEAVAIAEGEGASDSGSEAGSSDSESGSEAGASGSDSGSGSSDGGGSGSEEETEDPALTLDPSEEQKRANAETETTQAEVLEHTVDTHESVQNWGGDPVHIVEVTERVIETIEQAETVIAEKDQKIKELETQIAELKQIEEKYNAILAEEEAKVLAQKQEKARAFAEKQGLDTKDVAVAEAIAALDYTKIAELTMAQVQEDEEPEPKEEPAPRITLASFVELDVGDNNAYGGLLSRRIK